MPKAAIDHTAMSKFWPNEVLPNMPQQKGVNVPAISK